eukprot:Pgem_evm1s1566
MKIGQDIGLERTAIAAIPDLANAHNLHYGDYVLDDNAIKNRAGGDSSIITVSLSLSIL